MRRCIVLQPPTHRVAASNVFVPPCSLLALTAGHIGHATSVCMDWRLHPYASRLLPLCCSTLCTQAFVSWSPCIGQHGFEEWARSLVAAVRNGEDVTAMSKGDLLAALERAEERSGARIARTRRLGFVVGVKG